MVEVVEYVNFTADCLCSNDFGVLRHIPSSINLSLMINLDIYLNSRLFLLCNSCASYTIRVVIEDVLSVVSGVL